MKINYILTKLFSDFGLLILLAMLFLATVLGAHFDFSRRSMIELWNLGHILLFFLISYFLIKYCPGGISKNRLREVLYIFIVVGVIGFLIEFEQFYFKVGTPDLEDIYKNYLGALLGYIVVKRKEKLKAFHVIKPLTIVLLLWAFLPITKAIIDEIQSELDFPVLADFEDPFELSRWSDNKLIELSSLYPSNGDASLKISFDTTLYSAIALNYFPRNWSNYNNLNFDIYNPLADNVKITCRIEDEQHQNDNSYSDRFNRKFTLQSGWNKINIALKDVKKSPQSREMNMKAVASIGIYTTRLLSGKIIYLDYIRLE